MSLERSPRSAPVCKPSPKEGGSRLEINTILDAVLKVLGIVAAWLNIREHRRRRKGDSEDE